LAEFTKLYFICYLPMNQISWGVCP